MDRTPPMTEEEQHWRSLALPMPARNAYVVYEEEFTLEESARLLRCVFPQDMADKWLVLLVDGFTLHFHRSWTGFLLYAVTFVCLDEDEPTRLAAADLVVNRDPAQYTCTDDALDVARVRWLIRSLLLGQDVELPVDPSLSADDALLAAWGFGGNAAFSAPAPDPQPEPEPGPEPERPPPDEPPALHGL